MRKGNIPSASVMNQGKTRTVKIDIPSNYDNTKPYRLVFGMHCMGGWAQGVVNEGYYGLKPLDAENSTIFVAPQGYVWDSNVPWSQQDFPFFDSLLVNLESNLCIDSSRVFSTGFSYGSMYTNSLAQNHQKVLRGVAVYETAGYNIYVPDNTGEPLAWMGVVGMSDELCPPKAGRDARDKFLKNNSDNGIALQETAPETTAGSGSHICYDYKQVNQRFPVRWCTADGSHIWNHADNGQSTWVPASTWNFITQF